MHAIWHAIEQSYAASDTVLHQEQMLTDMFPGDAKYTFETRGSQLVRVYSPAFCKAYDASMNGMVERRFRQSIQMVAAFWLTAWINAGQPELPQIVSDLGLSKEELLEEEKFKQGLILGRPEEH
jgi:hypothetical protein